MLGAFAKQIRGWFFGFGSLCRLRTLKKILPSLEKARRKYWWWIR